MSRTQHDVPPAGEEIHLPPGSLQPVILTIGITLALVGVTSSAFVLISGLVIMLWTLVLWIRDARREYDELPAHHGPDHPA